MSNFTPHQEQAIQTIERNVAVSAGAGSGKTRVLVERFMYILEQGLATQRKVQADNVLAITFTKKAAGEMKSRLRGLLQEKVEQTEEQPDSYAFWRSQLQSLDRAQISTIHSLCSRILRENPVEAQLDPNFLVADDFEGQQFELTQIKRFVYDQLAAGNDAVKQLAGVYGVASLLSQLQDLLPALHDIVQAGDLTAAYQTAGSQLVSNHRKLVELYEDIAENRESYTKAKSKGREALDDLYANLDDVLARLEDDNPDYAYAWSYISSIRASGELKECKDNIKAIGEEQVQLMADKLAAPLMPAWQAVLTDLHAYLQEMKKKQELLTFDDLELKALALLSQNEGVRHKYQQKYMYIMVDEFQDTNEKQRKLIYWLCGDSDEKLLGHNLFVVGDPKQSIYRFRGANVSVFARVRKDIEATGGELISLKKNFRSVDKVLDACNSAFKQLMGEDKTQDVYFEELSHHWNGDTVPTLLQVLYDKDCGYDKRVVEAEAVVQRIVQLHETDHVDYSKIAILVRAMTHVDKLAAALQRHGVNYQIIDGKGFYECQEVLDLLHLFTVLQNRYRNLELAGVLRSPYFGLDDETLTKLFLLEEGDCLWDKLQQAADRVEKVKADSQYALVKRAARVLTELRQAACLEAVPELWHTVWHALEIDAVLSLQEFGPNRLANITKLRDSAITYAMEKQAGLGDWLQYIDDVRAAEARETTANLADVQSAVSILTIHKSKGLEFDTVFVPMIDSNGNSDKSTAKFMEGIGLGVKVPDDTGKLVDTSVLKRVRTEDTKLEQAERMRQLYVAMTRAEERLVLSGVTNGKDKKENKELRELNWFKQLSQIFASDDAMTLEQVDVDMQQTAVTAEQETRIFTDEEMAAMHPLASYLDNGKRTFTPSALQEYLHCERKYYYQQIVGLPGYEPPNEDETGETTAYLPAYVVGLIAHRTMELYHDDLDKAFAVAVSEQARTNPLVNDTTVAPIRTMLEDYIAHAIYQDLPEQQEREISIGYELPNGLFISGIIDLLADNGDGTLMIMDYKTGRAPEEGTFNRGYAYQLALYKMAVEAKYGKRVSKAELHYLQNLSTWQLPMDEGAAAYHDYTQEAMDLCMTIHDKQQDEGQFACNGTYCEHCEYSYICTRK